MCNVFLVRHGLSQSNIGLPTIDPASVQLTPTGQDQGQRVAEFFENHHISLDRIITSIYIRTKETAIYTQESFPKALCETWDVREFTYLSSMHKQSSTIKERRPLVNAYWKRLNPTYRDAPDSESFAEFVGRVRQFLTGLQALKGETIVVFSHEQFINMVLWLIERNPRMIFPRTMGDFRKYFKQYPVANGEIVCLTRETDWHPWNSRRITSHLQSSSEPVQEFMTSSSD